MANFPQIWSHCSLTEDSFLTQSGRRRRCRLLFRIVLPNDLKNPYVECYRHDLKRNSQIKIYFGKLTKLARPRFLIKTKSFIKFFCLRFNCTEEDGWKNYVGLPNLRRWSYAKFLGSNPAFTSIKEQRILNLQVEVSLYSWHPVLLVLYSAALPMSI